MRPAAGGAAARGDGILARTALVLICLGGGYAELAISWPGQPAASNFPRGTPERGDGILGGMAGLLIR